MNICKYEKAVDKTLQLQDNIFNFIEMVKSDDWEERQSVNAQRAGGWWKPVGRSC